MNGDTQPEDNSFLMQHPFSSANSKIFLPCHMFWLCPPSF